MKRFRVTIGMNHYYLSEKEKDFYLKSISEGQDYVVLPSGKILSRGFLDIATDESIQETLELDGKIESGKWECEHGSWHYRGSDCTCEQYEFIDEEDRPLKLPNVRPGSKSLVKAF